MKCRKTHVFSLLMALVLCVFLLPVSASAAESSVTTWSDPTSGSSARIVTVPMTPGRTGQISLANNSVVSDMSAQTHIDTMNAQPGTNVAAAINGGPSFSGEQAILTIFRIYNQAG